MGLSKINFEMGVNFVIGIIFFYYFGNKYSFGFVLLFGSNFLLFLIFWFWYNWVKFCRVFSLVNNLLRVFKYLAIVNCLLI